MTSLVHTQAEAVALHRPYLYRYALAKVRRAETAEDVVQDTLMAALEGQAPFRGESVLRTWLIGILKHKIVDWQRREVRDPLLRSAAPYVDVESETEETADTLFDSAGGWVTPPSTWANPEQCVENQRFRELLDNCLAALPVATARAFYLREVEGCTTTEICAQLGISESNCWVMLYRARTSLRRSLEKRWFLEEERRTSGAAAPRHASQARTEPKLKPGRCDVARLAGARHARTFEATRTEPQTAPA